MAFDHYDCNTGSDFHIRTKSVSPFFRPKLRITSRQNDELTDFRWPIYNIDGVQVSPNRLRRFVKFIVENHGGEPAENCQARLRVLDRIDSCDCLTPGDEKSLPWDNNEIKRTIGAKYDKPYFYLVFSQEETETTNPTYCGIIKENISEIQTWIGTIESSQNPKRREQDKLCRGKFRVHVDVFTEFGQRVYSDFIIDVGTSWRDLNAEKSECTCIKHSLFRRLVRKLSRSH